MKENTLWIWVRMLATLGIILAVYLLFEQVTRSPYQPCNINSTVNCNAIISGEVSKTFGLPTPLYGLVGYFIIFFATFYKTKKLLLWTGILGLLFCLWIAYVELFTLRVICPVCITCQLDMIGVVILSVFLFNKKKSS